ncbi:sensor histidine kinase [Phytoactinopolyspora limicola]|uniref:sensor histidine kinase n=1 Tax=Phytoactinopolyspora limicola TaxID=2715536 RepID=UPI00140A5EDD|nr:histidine kinase [Phytoactinopolyspora limicola]
MSLRWILTPLVSRSTFRRGVHLLLGGVILLPYVLLAFGFVQMFADPETPLIPVAVLAAVTVAIGTIPAFLPVTRALEIAAARSLLDVPLPEPERNPPWETRWRGASWYGLHLICGGGIMLAMLFVAPVVAMLVTKGIGAEDGWLADVDLAPFHLFDGVPAVIVGIGLTVALIYVVSITGRVLATVAPVLLEPSSLEQIRALEAEAQRLTERNRLARELHDSVGHALTVTTLQAAAARQVLDSDTELVRRALQAIEDAGRSAMDDLDHVLGLLREHDPVHDGPAQGDRRTKGDGRSEVTVSTAARQRRQITPQRRLDDIGRLVDEMRVAGLEVDAMIEVDATRVPAVTSREAYRIAQEGLTNALRHAGGVAVTLRVVGDADGVDIEMINPLDVAHHGQPGGTKSTGQWENPAGGGRGLLGMRERVNVLGGSFVAGPDADVWVVRAHLPGANDERT